MYVVTNSDFFGIQLPEDVAFLSHRHFPLQQPEHHQRVVSRHYPTCQAASLSHHPVVCLLTSKYLPRALQELLEHRVPLVSHQCHQSLGKQDQARVLDLVQLDRLLQVRQDTLRPLAVLHQALQVRRPVWERSDDKFYVT